MTLQFRSPVTFALFVASMYLLAFNRRFWLDTTAAFWHGSPGEGLFLAVLGLLLLLCYAGALLLIPGRVAMMTVAGLLFPAAAMAAYCADSFGVVIDREMIRNLGETDSRELMGVFTPRLLVYIIGLGVLPVFLVARSRIVATGWRTGLRQRAGFIAVAVLAVVLTYGLQPRLRTFLSEHGRLHQLSVPAAAAHAAGAYLHAQLQAAPAGGPAARQGGPWRLPGRPGAKPLLVFLVVGETARHASFQLGGYPRETNPGLGRVGNLYYFTRAESCATSTAVSVPCMLSHLGREHFSLSAYPRVPNVLEDLAATGVDLEWRSNNTARFEPGKGVRKVEFPAESHPALCSDESCYDDILLEGMEQAPLEGSADRLVAFHQMGSHGPAYFLRYPPEQEAFRPACRNKDLGACSAEELRNAYDNTIRYTDRLLSRMIALLDAASARYDTALVYVSDHGESLGENGVFLHSAPYGAAPEEQKRIPFMVWISEGYRQRFAIDGGCLRRRLDLPVSHDNVYHTLLGLFAARNEFYAGGMDVLAACRANGN